MNNRWPTLDILGTRIDCVDFAQMLHQIVGWIDDSSPPTNPKSKPPNPQSPPFHQICTINPEFIIDARRDPHFAAVLRRADLCVPDGVGVLWAARRQGVTLRERVTGSDGIYRIAGRAAQAGWRLFLLGAAPGVADQAADVLRAKSPGVQIVGTHSGSPRDGDWPAIEQALAQSQPDFLFVAFGHPRQDLWIDEHRDEWARSGVRVAMGVGGAFDLWAGVQRRAPRSVQRLGLEWSYRLMREPWRWRRMAKLPQFVGLVLRERSSGVVERGDNHGPSVEG